MKRKNKAEPLKAMSLKLRKGVSYLSTGGMRQIFNHIDQASIKKEVERMGLEKFINKCALLAAGSGLLTGIGGIATMAIGVPLDMINLLAQQFRVTIAVSYKNTGSTKVQFEDLIKMIAATLKVDAGMAVTKNIMEEVAEKLMMNIGSKTAERLVPVVGAAIGGSVNYLFIKRMANSAIRAHVK